ncbi:hypothetical protein [Pseudomonas phage PJNP013]|uniref:Uncharacterized protein n=1 Tax=Pseudomonas phage PJNP013 TaxID=3108093 RepID=A0ABZ2CNL7_9CAUD
MDIWIALPFLEFGLNIGEWESQFLLGMTATAIFIHLMLRK